MHNLIYSFPNFGRCSFEFHIAAFSSGPPDSEYLGAKRVISKPIFSSTSGAEIIGRVAAKLFFNIPKIAVIEEP